MLLYAITSGVLLADEERERARNLTALAARWAAAGVDYIQVREKDLEGRPLAALLSSISLAAETNGARTRVLLNGDSESAADIAIQAGAGGVHLQGNLESERLTEVIVKVRDRFLSSGQSPRNPITPPAISVSCHSVAEVRAARAAGATLALFAPVFEKVLPDRSALLGSGLQRLAEACSAASEAAPHPPLLVFALGGVTRENASQCVAAGAAGIAGIRLFLDFESRRASENVRSDSL